MSLDTTKIIRACEKMRTLTMRAAISADRDTHRDAILETFGQLATDLDKIATSFRPAEWGIELAVGNLHSAAVYAEETSSETFAPIGGQAALVTSLHAFAATLGFVLSDADTADLTPEDEQARRYAEGAARMAAE